jgi:hypothetical protein
MKDIYDLKGKLLDYIKEGHINKDTLISNLFDYLNEAELEDFVIMYNYMTEDELSESLSEFTDSEHQIIRDTIDKFYPEYRRRPIGRFLDDVQMNTLSDDCYVDLDDARNEHMVSDSDIEKMITIDEYYVGANENVGIVSMLNPKDGKIYRYADF